MSLLWIELLTWQVLRTRCWCLEYLLSIKLCSECPQHLMSRLVVLPKGTESSGWVGSEQPLQKKPASHSGQGPQVTSWWGWWQMDFLYSGCTRSFHVPHIPLGLLKWWKWRENTYVYIGSSSSKNESVVRKSWWAQNKPCSSCHGLVLIALLALTLENLAALFPLKWSDGSEISCTHASFPSSSTKDAFQETGLSCSP